MTSLLDTQLETLNHDHTELLQILQAAKRSIQDGENIKDSASAILEARDRFRLHSEKEEMLMQMVAYPEAADANADHMRLQSLFDALVQTAEGGVHDDLASSLHTLMVEIVGHIRNHDRKYAEFIHSHMDVPHIDPHLLRE
jgi:hemerythrin-like metal-binding protein